MIIIYKALIASIFTEDKKKATHLTVSLTTLVTSHLDKFRQLLSDKLKTFEENLGIIKNNVSLATYCNRFMENGPLRRN